MPSKQARLVLLMMRKGSNDVDPQAWLADVLARIVSEFLPPFSDGLDAYLLAFAAFQAQGVSSARWLFRCPLTSLVRTSVR